MKGNSYRNPFYKDSIAFMDNIEEFCKKAAYLNHINFSGLFHYDSDGLQLKNLCRCLAVCPQLMAVHLSDN